jgi:F-type H+-transporting ATPase subunit epsilon
MATTQVELVTPSGLLFSGQAEMVVCRTEGGDIAFLANHMPYVGALEAHPLRIVHPDGEDAPEELNYDVHGGFVEVNGNRVVVLCDAASVAEPE